MPKKQLIVIKGVWDISWFMQKAVSRDTAFCQNTAVIRSLAEITLTNSGLQAIWAVISYSHQTNSGPKWNSHQRQATWHNLHNNRSPHRTLLMVLFSTCRRVSAAFRTLTVRISVTPIRDQWHVQWHSWFGCEPRSSLCGRQMAKRTGEGAVCRHRWLSRHEWSCLVMPGRTETRASCRPYRLWTWTHANAHLCL